jgi:enamine deaminase RidA (YjgF/YER057c/UK114 family)
MRSSPRSCVTDDQLCVSAQPGDLAFVTLPSPAGQHCSAEELVQRVYVPLGELLRERQAVLVSERVFGALSSAPRVLRARRELLGDVLDRALPRPTFVEGQPCLGAGFAGFQAIAVIPSGERPDVTVRASGVPCGRIVFGRDATFVGLADIGQALEEKVGLSQADEAERILAAAEAALVSHGFCFRDVRRTWFYLERILAWYGDFNRVRNAAFRRMGLFNCGSLTPIPASTGIEGRKGRGSCALDLIATAARPGGRHEVARLTHGRQNEATEYGSAFSRGLALTLEHARYVFVSGTASIDEHGASVHSGDFEAQTRHTLQAVRSLLAAGGATLADVEQATAFLKRREDLPAYRRIAEQEGLASLPVVCTVADVCRDELLFELDATAVVPTGL